MHRILAIVVIISCLFIVKSSAVFAADHGKKDNGSKTCAPKPAPTVQPQQHRDQPARHDDGHRDNCHHGDHHNNNFRSGAIGFIAGALAIAAWAQPVYALPAPVYIAPTPCVSGRVIVNQQGNVTVDRSYAVGTQLNVFARTGGDGQPLSILVVVATDGRYSYCQFDFQPCWANTADRGDFVTIAPR